jgi:hypothetical protein
MAVDVSSDLELSDQLTEWFWNFGVHRQSKYPPYAISTSEWLKIVYEIRKDLSTVAEAAQAVRPCTAIWGPSQTGKSTLVSAYLDEKAVINGVLGEDGTGSALHWPGGEPALFMDPVTIRQQRAAQGVSILNPFNNGKDASACLSRFVYGSLTPQPGAYFVANPKFPIQIQLATEKDLLHALARGFDSECWGHAPKGGAKTWDVDKLQAEITTFQATANSNGDIGVVDRRAYEMLHDFCEVLDDLVFAGLRRYRDLGNTERKYRSAIASILGEKSLISNPANAEQFIARVFWEECEPFTEYYRAMRDALHKYEKQWKGRTLHCDIQTAVLLLDMDIYDLLSNPGPADPTALGRKNPTKVDQLVSSLGCRIEGDRVFIGQVAENRLFPGERAKNFAILQGLVWELIIPLNPEHLQDSPFLNYLKQADLLDFPGVANVVPNPSTTVKCECRHREKDDMAAPVSAEQVQTPPAFDASAFFTQILKRGKTASIVSTYAKRLTIDGFVIFQNIDGNPAANAEQLQTGIMTWWRAMVPSYFKEHEGKRSPLPLNLGLLWWRRVFDEADLGKPDFGKFSWIWKNLGKLGDPKIVTTFALNYYGLARGKPSSGRTQEELETLIRQIQKEDQFREQFDTQVSQASFEQMFTDRQTGGANFFFSQLAQQVVELRQRSDFNRDAILENKSKDSRSRIQGLLDERNLFPPPEERDIRKENLLAFKQFLDAQIQKGFLEPKMRALNYALRCYLNVHQDDLSPVPANSHEISEKYIRDQYDRWINCKVDRYRRSSAYSNGGPTIDWALIGITSETICREYLGALVSSVRPEAIQDVGGWLRDLLEYSVHTDGRVDYRPYLATRMANEIVYGPSGIPTFDGDFADDIMNDFQNDRATAPLGKDCPSYQVFVKEFLEQRLPELINMNVRGDEVPQDLPGVKELRDLCQKFGWVPQIYATYPGNGYRVNASVPPASSHSPSTTYDAICK